MPFVLQGEGGGETKRGGLLAKSAFGGEAGRIVGALAGRGPLTVNAAADDAAAPLSGRLGICALAGGDAGTGDKTWLRPYELGGV